jgi:hypothetical protein
MANNTDVERLNYYEGEFLGAVDFQAEQQYHREMRRRHNIGQHTWGIVSGLDLVQMPNGALSTTSQPTVDILLQPGMAVDGFGREIIVLSKTLLTQDLFAAYFDSNPAAPPKPMYVWISFSQRLLNPPTDTCSALNQPNAFGRVQETFALTVTPDPTGPADDLMVVDGKAMSAPVPPGSTPPPPTSQPGDIILPADDSVPCQEFASDDSSVHWFVCIGRVFWDPNHEVFVEQPPDWPSVGREYAGNVTAAILTPGSSLQIRDRFAPYPLPSATTDPFYGGVGVQLAGSLTLDRLLDAKQDLLVGGPYNPLNPASLSPLTVVASGNNQDLIQFRNSSDQETWLICQNPGGANPGLHIGEMPAGGVAPGTTRIFIQNTQTGTAPSLVNVGIGTPNPQSPLSIRAQGAGQELLSFEDPGGAPKWHVNQNQSSAAGLNFGESSGDFRLFLQVGGNVGIGTSAPQQNLSVNRALNIDQANANSSALQPGLTFGSSSLEGIASNRNPGLNQFGLDFFTVGQPRLSITSSGNVGIGTRSPSALLEVNGPARFDDTLRVSGNQNIFGAKAFTFALKNVGTTDAFKSWSANYTNQFEQVYLVFAVLQGFSIFNNENNLTFNGTGHVQGNDVIPQHAFVRVDTWNTNSAAGVCYCSESDPGNQGNNTILFTVVVLGKPKF